MGGPRPPRSVKIIARTPRSACIHLWSISFC